MQYMYVTQVYISAYVIICVYIIQIPLYKYTYLITLSTYRCIITQ